MKTTKEKFLEVVSKEKNTSLERTRERVKNKEVIREARYIAMKILDRLEELGWSQKRLAEELQVSPQQVNKIVKGSENLTLETLVKLQKILKISLLVSDLERQSADFSTSPAGIMYSSQINRSFNKVKKYSDFNQCDIYTSNEYVEVINLKVPDRWEIKMVNKNPFFVSDSPVILEGKAYKRLGDKPVGTCFTGGEEELY
jgi:transcriptional regulator with XRE-family HTH domain